MDAIAVGAHCLCLPDMSRSSWLIATQLMSPTCNVHSTHSCRSAKRAVIGLARWLPSLDEHYDADGIAPDDRVFAIGQINQKEGLFADFDLVQVGRWPERMGDLDDEQPKAIAKGNLAPTLDVFSIPVERLNQH